jgi:hypothetical protein
VSEIKRSKELKNKGRSVIGDGDQEERSNGRIEFKLTRSSINSLSKFCIKSLINSLKQFCV